MVSRYASAIKQFPSEFSVFFIVELIRRNVSSVIYTTTLPWYASTTKQIPNKIK